ncbi:hypothetical protein PTTG_27257 [Puccinia triticina 1-1 BBBD Race 1]|uniref:hAT-like transposase RNase-H fold domain-containing protein n=1 Tax=Puccinia triticina (isolate 1-1 / race 1 (BBBD)) TaxID=630390 RepID=A0A180GLX1_PUCT1|nr:hypothetical protein PTTG_27257 [Puccinia triticina 1-1 BBBD Race 1]
MPCRGRKDAINDGANLPATVKDKEAAKLKAAPASKFLLSGLFDNRSLNQLLVMWIVQSALPWTQIQDFLLGVAFNYARQGIRIYSRTWAATKAHRLYISLQEKVLNTLRLNKSKITLIHDVWTTKGNHHAFMGIAAAYISDDWIFKLCHLGMKYISWTHKGKYLATTDSGSNNGTMTSEVDRLVGKKTCFNLNLSQNHIKCFCHKVALILSAGLKEIEMASEGLTRDKESTLGFVPELTSISEESKDQNDSSKQPATFESDNELIESSSNESEIAPVHIEAESNPAAKRKKPNMISSVLKKVDYVIQQITSSAARRSEFNIWAEKLEYNGPSLIAGYGIRWNIKWQSRDCAYQARTIINKLIENEKDRQERDGGKNFYQEYVICRGDWEIVKKLNDILGEFYFITKKMEGDRSSACLMIAEYLNIINFLRDQIELTTEVEFRTMMRLVQGTPYLH